MKKTYLYGIVVVSLSLIISGCGKGLVENDSKQGTMEQLEVSTSAETIDLEANKILKNKIWELQQSRDRVIELQNMQVDIINLLHQQDQTDWVVLPMYNFDIEVNKTYINYYIKVEASMSLEEKLRIICENLSNFSFGGIPINFKEIQLVEGKRVAVIDIREFEENIGVMDMKETKGVTWRGHYFQGSSGGAMTSVKLLESFLQRSFTGDWIDGVKILYNGTVENPYSDHVGQLIDVIHYR